MGRVLSKPGGHDAARVVVHGEVEAVPLVLFLERRRVTRRHGDAEVEKTRMDQARWRLRDSPQSSRAPIAARPSVPGSGIGV